MTESALNILLVEDNPGDARLIRELLTDGSAKPFMISTADRLAHGLEQFADQSFDLVLLDLFLPDSTGLDTLRRFQATAPDVPVIVLTGLNDEESAIQAVRDGAQDYLVKGQIDGQQIVRAIRYARERHRMVLQIRDLSLVDELTGLHNRRGFAVLARELMKRAVRTGTGLVVAFVDLDGMKRINDRFGHEVGDRALIRTAGVLRSIFRVSDVIARIGGDEFIAMTDGVDGTAVELLRRRLARAVDDHNRESAGEPELALSLGFAHHNPTTDTLKSIDDLIAEADEAMYVDKDSRRTKAVQR
ncbi:diguanylate cyclase response regulator [Mesorhizobium sp. VK23B]|uniref:diguanylate cyclase n=1 Tax=Mesorhizobium dulcispinae TaxID=3072316 RepID=A0ABU4XKW2_9HYPH|nr:MULTISPECIES: diguanylate cyclase response regulator [unclassified Mesorhizobium]MDX8467924.1 diguanylate cyclase response regulator [Mesorhizobium sp. VK23B]MDX8474262.1 diguanylate cyclase response regulator [Mesorhizobium sp. VK23A]MDX8521240.1 diguanylate cyclase response regulator [Mesorhizobium sp. VK23D]